MIRLVQRRLIIPRGDTGVFSVPALPNLPTEGVNVAVFTIFSAVTRKKIFEKVIGEVTDEVVIRFTHDDTVNLPVGRYLWDIKIYNNPTIEDEVLTDGEEVDSYYSAYRLPECEIRPSGDALLTADDAPNTTIPPDQLNILRAAISETKASEQAAASSAEEASQSAQEAAASATAAEQSADEIKELQAAAETLAADAPATASYDAATGILTIGIPRGEKGDTGEIPQEWKDELDSVAADVENLATVANTGSYNDLTDKPFIPIKISDLTDDSGHYIKPATGIPASDLEETYLTEHQDISGKANIADLATVATTGSYNDLSNKPTIPSKVSDLTNDAGYISGYTETDPTVPAWAKAAQKPAYTAAEVGAPTTSEMNTAIATAIGNVHQFELEVVQELPTTGIKEHTIYLVPKTGETNDVYDEYIKVNDAWEMIGNTQIDLSNYVQKTDYADGTNAGVIKVTSGSGLRMIAGGGYIGTDLATLDKIKAATNVYNPIVPAWEHAATFYGLAKAAGDSTQASSENAVGTYTDNAKTAIQTMLDVPAKADIPTKTSDLTNDSGFLTSYTETDPTVPQWAKASTKPNYTAVEVGALPADTHIPSTTAELTNDAGFITNADVPTKISDLTNDSDFVRQYYGVCNTEGGTATKQVTISNLSEITTGTTILVKFNAANTASNPKLEINGGNQIPIYRGASAAGNSASASWIAGSVVQLTYDGTNWVIDNSNNTTYGSMTDEQVIAGTSTTNLLISPARVKLGVETHAPVKSVNGQTGEVEVNAVDYGQAQQLTEEQQLTALANLGLNAAEVPTQDEVYSMRAVPTGNKVKIDQIVGGTVAFNQSLPPLSSGNGWIAGGCSVSWGNNEVTGTVTQTGVSNNYSQVYRQDLSRITEHKYLTLAEVSVISGTVSSIACTSGSSSYSLTPPIMSPTNGTWYTLSSIINQWDSHMATFAIRFNLSDPSTTDSFKIRNAIQVDLTQMFGSDVADYIYSLETATAGAGVALFREMFPASYYSYNAGELMSVQTSGRVSGGQTYPLDSTLTLRGIPALTDGKLTYDGDQYAPNGTVTRRYGIVDLGSLTWVYSPTNNVFRSSTVSTMRGVHATYQIIAARKYTMSKTKYLANMAGAEDHVICLASDNSYIFIKDSEYVSEGAGDTDALGLSLSGNYAVYELATPTTETATPYQSLQIADSTEEFIDAGNRDVAVPVGVTAGYYNATTIDLDLSDKADKVANATSGNFAALDANGNLTDSGHKHSDYLTAHQDLSNYVQKTDFPNGMNAGVVRVAVSAGIASDATYGILTLTPLTHDLVKGGDCIYAVSPTWQHESAFYGLAKAAGDSTQSSSDNAVGTYTTEAKAAIRSMIGAAASADVGVQDVQVNGTSVVSSGVANIPIATASSGNYGVTRIVSDNGVGEANGALYVLRASDSQIIAGSNNYRPIVPGNQHKAVFYGLAGAAGVTSNVSTPADSFTAYTDTAKGAIQKMLGVTDLFGNEENDVTATRAYAVGEAFISNGKLYRATAAIAQDGAIVTDGSGANCVEISVTGDYVKKTDWADDYHVGVVKSSSNYGTTVSEINGTIMIVPATEAEIKAKTQQYKPIVPLRIPQATFYGLAAAAGDTTQTSSSNAVGTYTDAAKTAIKSMLGITDSFPATSSLTDDFYSVKVTNGVSTLIKETVDARAYGVDAGGTGDTINVELQRNRRIVYGEMVNIQIMTVPSYGLCGFTFISGTTPTVLTLPNTVVMPEWWTGVIETNRRYDIMFLDGHGAVMSWPL